MPRLLFAFLLRSGYNGPHKERLAQMLDNTIDTTLKMQSVTGEMPFGGRSNQFLHNEAMVAAYFELEANRLFEAGKVEKASECVAAAELATQNLLYYLSFNPISHIKNRYDPADMIGCESYGYFNKYMITLASNIYLGALFANKAIPSKKPAVKEAPYIFSTTDEFNKTFMHAGGYFLEIDTAADLQYDANGLGRLQKKNACPVICLAVPFPRDTEHGTNPHFGYKTEKVNPRPMSLCCEGGADVPYTLTKSSINGDTLKATFVCEKGTEEYTVSAGGVDISYGQTGFMLPVFEFDGAAYTDICIEKNRITVAYQNSVCEYSFDGNCGEFEHYYNRNGRYRVYRINGQKLHIEIKEQTK